MAIITMSPLRGWGPTRDAARPTGPARPVLLAELQDALHRLGHRVALALGEAAEPGDDGVGVLALEIPGDPGELTEGALALPVVHRRVRDLGDPPETVLWHAQNPNGVLSWNTPSMV